MRDTARNTGTYRPGEELKVMTELSNFSDDIVAAIPSLHAFARRLTRNADRADDIVQETLAKAWAKQKSFTYGTNLKAWLFTIARNEFYSHARKLGREVQDTGEVDTLSTGGFGMRPAQESSLGLRELREAMARLPQSQREALVLVGVSGHSYDEAAEMCRCPAGTIKSRVNRARSRLQELLDPPCEYPDGPIPFGMPVLDPRDRCPPTHQARG